MYSRLPKHSFHVILADPPWGFKTYNKSISTKSARSKYPVMTLRDLARMDVASLAAPNCVLVMWATQAQLPDAIELMKAWGFSYKTAGAWGKRAKGGKKWAFGTGYLFRSCAEFFILGTRGTPKSASNSERNFIDAKVREHSRKPDEMYEILERMYPHAERLELFARGRREGWIAFGNETKRFA